MKTSDMDVILIDKMGDDLRVVDAARVSFAKKSMYEYKMVLTEEAGEALEELGWELDENVFYSDTYVAEGMPYKRLKESDQKLIKYLAKHNHWSPFSHCFATFKIKAPIFVARQLAKHQVGFAWNEVSRRYVDSEPEFYFPDSWRKRADNVKQGSSDAPVMFKYTPSKDVVTASLDAYTKAIEDGVCAEQARMLLPQNMMTEWYWSGSLTAWARMCNLRLESTTQRETQEIAYRIELFMRELFPYSWKELVSSDLN